MNVLRTGRHRPIQQRIHRRWLRLTVVIAFVVVTVAGAFALQGLWQADPPSLQLTRDPLPTTPASYVGVYREGVPSSYGVVNEFTAATGVKPDVVPYYSGWEEKFQAGFATSVAKHGAVPLVQINPFGVSLAAIAAGQDDSYLTTYAKAVRSYGRPVILSFGHEMNGNWYPWGYKHTSPVVFVAAWRHMVTVFRKVGARNVTWMWTVNVIHTNRSIPSPVPWWPGRSYVTWVGMDGYYYNPSWRFATLFGPTITAVRELTHDPILISETAVSPAANQPAKIGDLFAGIKLYGLLGLVWFDANRDENWSLDNPPAISAFRRGAEQMGGS
jgi:mannan endo-1,4-beta-mannosidase